MEGKEVTQFSRQPPRSDERSARSQLEDTMKAKIASLKRVLVVIVMLVAVAATAQDMQMPKPGPEMERVRFLIGTWDLNGEYAKSSMVPQGGKSTGWYKAQLGPGGFSVIADFESDGPLGKEIGHQVFTWNPKQSVYTVVTVGNFPGAIIGRAHWEGDNLITEAEFEFGGAKMSNRSVYSNVQDKSIIHIEESSRMGDGPLEPLWKADAAKK
jgi:hypothetical protein